MTGDRSLFKVFESKKGGNITFGDGSKSQVKGKGIISLPGLPDIASVLYLVMNESGKKLISDVRTLDNCYGLVPDANIVCNSIRLPNEHLWHHSF